MDYVILYHKNLPEEGRQYSKESAAMLLGKNVGFSEVPLNQDNAVNREEDTRADIGGFADEEE